MLRKGPGRPMYESNFVKKLHALPNPDLFRIARKTCHITKPEKWTPETRELIIDAIVAEKERSRIIVPDPGPGKRVRAPRNVVEALTLLLTRKGVLERILHQ